MILYVIGKCGAFSVKCGLLKTKPDIMYTKAKDHGKDVGALVSDEVFHSCQTGTALVPSDGRHRHNVPSPAQD